MFVSSYSAYIQTNSDNKNIKNRDVSHANSSNYSSKVYEENLPKSSNKASFAVDYIAKNNSFYTKLFLEKNQDEQSEQTKNLTHKFIDQNTLQDAKKAYTQVPKMASFFRETFMALDKTLQVEPKFTQSSQNLKEAKMRKLMINTYIDNDNYYKITA